MAEIPAEARHLFEGKNFAHIATLNPDGSPQNSPVWVGIEGDTVTFNTAAGRVKPRNLEQDPRIAISIVNQENPYEHVLVQGNVVAITEEGADEDIDALAKRYMDVDEYPLRQPGEKRLIVKIEPEKVTHQAP
jgi:PPOX class probable F420-dependent enzyme